MSPLSEAAQRSDLLASLRRLEGRATLGDLTADSGLPTRVVKDGLNALLEEYEGHVAVSDSGELLYHFDARLIERGSEPFALRAWRGIRKLLRGAFKAWIVVMLVGYFVLFVVLVIAALFAQRGGGSRGSWGRGRRGRVHFPNFWLWYWIWGPRWRLGRPYYGHRWERTLHKDDKVPFYKKVFAFVFGPDRPQPTQKQIDRRILRLIRARSGVLTTAELLEHTALTYPQAESEMGRLLGAYEGEALASPDGELVYAFPELTKSLHGGRHVRAPDAAWLRLEYPLELTGNSPGANALVAGMNGFTLVAAATAPWFIFPRLGIGGPVAFFAMVLVPVVFSVLFFGIPLLRWLGVTRENRRRSKRNVRRVLLGLVYRRALEGGRAVGAREAHLYVTDRLRGQSVSASEVDGALRDLAAELNADVTANEAGELEYTFSGLLREVRAGEVVRRGLALEARELGEIVFSTADTPEEAGARDLRLFDRTLDVELDPERYAPATDRVDFEHDYEIVAFDEELRRG